jgi:hypothetical protein
MAVFQLIELEFVIIVSLLYVTLGALLRTNLFSPFGGAFPPKVSSEATRAIWLSTK